jgi:dipeptidyl aminopeptidase/acylaminoacyl peptidase
MTQSKLPPLIPREVLFGNPQRTHPQISPDGRYLAYIAPNARNTPQVWLRTIGHADDCVLTAANTRGIQQCFWAYDGEHILYLQDTDGDEHWHVYAVNRQSKLVRDLTPFVGTRARMVACEPRTPHEILVAINLRDPGRHDVYRINLQSGAAQLDTLNTSDVITWTADAALYVRAALAFAADGGFDLLVRPSGAAPTRQSRAPTPTPSRDDDPVWQFALHWGSDDRGHVVGFSMTERLLYLISTHNANTRRLLALDIVTGKETILAEDQEYDVDDDPWYHRVGVFFHPTERIVQAVAFYRDTLEWQVLDQMVAADFEAITRIHAGEFHVTSRDLADRTWLVAYTPDDGPVTYYAYNRNSKTAERLFSDRPELESASLARKQPFTLRARDGLTLHGYLTLPIGVEPRNLPTVLLVHGGPHTRDRRGFEPEVQWLTNRGYAVLQVNYRGSTGYGKAFQNAGNREWGGKMNDDLIDAVAWLVGQGVAHPRQIAIMGFSYGGYATLAGLTFTSDVFAAGVALCGGSNLLTWLRSDPPATEAERAMTERLIGDPETEAAFLQSRSPFFFADHLRVPLLIALGANDPRVPQAEGNQIVAALRQAGKPVEYIVYTDEGHGLTRAENRLHFYAKVEAFLAQHLGGRAEPLTEIPGHAGVDM